MGRFGRGLELTKLSFKVIGKNKSLLVFPVLSGISILLLLTVVFLGFWFVPGIEDAPSWLWFIVGFVIYFLLFFISFFFQAALIACAYETLEGGSATLGFGLRKASSRIGSLLMWALIAAIVGMILQALESRAGILGRIVIRIVGAAWAIATYFTVPIIVFEDVKAWAAVKRSWQTLKGSWGETIVGNLAVGLIFFLLFLIVLPLVIALGYLGNALNLSGVAFFAMIAIAAVVYIAFIMALHAAVRGVLQAALYRYVKTGKLDITLPSWIPPPAGVTPDGAQVAYKEYPPLQT